MPLCAVLLDLYDTLVDGDWQGWRAQLSTLTGIDEDTLGMAYHLTREERNTGAYPTAEDSVRALLGAAGLEAPSEDLVHTVVEAEEAFGGEIRLYDDSLPTVIADYATPDGRTIARTRPGRSWNSSACRRCSTPCSFRSRSAFASPSPASTWRR